MQRVRVSSHQSPVHKLGQTQMTLSPKFKLASTNSSSLEMNPSLESSSPLIPNLPDDVALNCLLRIPIGAHVFCRSVCKRWGLLFSKKEHFFTLRKALGFHDPWLFTFTFHRCMGKIQWMVLDLTQLSWHKIPSMPCRDRVCPHGFGCIALESTLLVCGGLVSDLDCPFHLVLKYEVVRNKWNVTTRMHTPRSFFASGLIDGKVYVAGGYSADQFELNLAEVFDPIKGTWKRVANMKAKMACYDSCVLNGRLYVTEGWLWPFLASPLGQVYDPKTDIWEDMNVGMREGWTGPSVVIDEHVFIVAEREGMRIKVYDAKSDSWDAIEGLPVPERIRKPFNVSVSGEKIYVVGRGLHVVIGYVKRLDANGRGRFCVKWQELDVPASKEFCDLTSSSSRILFA